MSLPSRELAAQTGIGKSFLTVEKIGRSEWNRTTGPCLPKTVLYQAELHSDRRRYIALSQGRSQVSAAARISGVGGPVPPREPTICGKWPLA